MVEAVSARQQALLEQQKFQPSITGKKLLLQLFLSLFHIKPGRELPCVLQKYVCSKPGCRHLILVKTLVIFGLEVVLFGEGTFWPILQFSALAEGWQQNTAIVQGPVISAGELVLDFLIKNLIFYILNMSQS